MEICTVLTSIIGVAKPIMEGIKSVNSRAELRAELGKLKEKAQGLKEEYEKISESAKNTARKLDKWNDIFLKLEDMEGTIFRLDVFLREKLKDRVKSPSSQYALTRITGELVTEAGELSHINISILSAPEVSSIINRISEIIHTIHKYALKESWDCIKLELDGNGSDIEPRYGLKEGISILRELGMQAMEPSPALKSALVFPMYGELPSQSLHLVRDWRKEWARDE